jgi:hypothetical protein
MATAQTMPTGRKRPTVRRQNAIGRKITNSEAGGHREHDLARSSIAACTFGSLLPSSGTMLDHDDGVVDDTPIISTMPISVMLFTVSRTRA